MSVVRYDFISIGLLVTAIAVFMYSSTFDAALMLKATFVTMLGVSGLVMSLATRTYGYDEGVSDPESTQLLTWFGVSFATILFMNLSVPALPLGLAVTGGTPVTQTLFSVLIAVSEESFFRGFITSYLASRLGVLPGALASGGFFAVYHLAVYGVGSGLIIVFGAGVILSYAALKTGRLSTTMLAHVVNNFWAAGGV